MKPVMLKTTLASLWLALGASAALAQEGPEQAALVEVKSVQNESIAEQIWLPGTVVSRTDANIASEVAGRIEWLADVGDIVEKGQTLAQLDARRLQLMLEQSQVNVEKWQARVEILDRKVERFSQMALKANTSKDQLDDVSIELEAARQSLAQSRYDLQLTQYQIEQSKVKAPYTAMVVERLQSPGEFTAVGQNLLRIVDTENIEASVRAPLTTIPYLDTGLVVNVHQQRLAHQQPIRAIVPVGNSQSRLMEVRVSLDPEDFAIGSAVRVALPHSDAHSGMTVPRDALVLRKAGTFIFQVNDNNEATRVSVTTGIGVDDRIEVLGEINHDYPVIVRGAERIRDGQKVRFEPEQTLLTARQ